MRVSVCASSGCTSVSPIWKNAPSFWKVCFDSGDEARLFDPLSDAASAYETGMPFPASSIDGAILSAHDRAPYLVSAISIPRTMPGTAADRQPSTLSRVGLPEASRYMSWVAVPGATSRKSTNVARACLLACWFGDESQQSVTPHFWHVRRCSQRSPIFTHSSHSRFVGCFTWLVSMESMCAQVSAMRRAYHGGMPHEEWPSLRYDEWKDTYLTLHLWSQVVGKVALALAPPINHSWAIAMRVTPRGVTTLPLPHGQRSFTMEFDFIQHRLMILTSDGDTRALPLSSMSVAEFYREVMATLHAMSLPVKIWPAAVELPDPIRLDEDVRHHSYVAEQANRFWRILDVRVMPHV